MEGPVNEKSSVSPESFMEIKDALRKTLHVMIDLDFEDGKLDGVINSFLDAKRFKDSTMQKKKLKAEILLNIETARKGKGIFSKEEYTRRYQCLWGDCSP